MTGTGAQEQDVMRIFEDMRTRERLALLRVRAWERQERADQARKWMERVAWVAGIVLVVVTCVEVMLWK